MCIYTHLEHHHHHTQMSALFKIATSKDPPPIPDTLSPECKDFLLLCFHRYNGDASCSMDKAHVHSNAHPIPQGSQVACECHTSVAAPVYSQHRATPCCIPGHEARHYQCSQGAVWRALLLRYNNTCAAHRLLCSPHTHTHLCLACVYPPQVQLKSSPSVPSTIPEDSSSGARASPSTGTGMQPLSPLSNGMGVVYSVSCFMHWVFLLPICVLAFPCAIFSAKH